MSDIDIIKELEHNPHLKHEHYEKGCQDCEQIKREKCDGIIKLSKEKKLKI